MKASRSHTKIKESLILLERSISLRKKGMLRVSLIQAIQTLILKRNMEENSQTINLAKRKTKKWKMRKTRMNL